MKHLFKSKTFKNILSILAYFSVGKTHLDCPLLIIWLPSSGVYHKDKVGGKVSLLQSKTDTQ